MMIQGSEFGDFGDLGWGWKSFTRAARKVGGGFKAVGKGAYNIAKMPYSMAKRVAASSASILCDKSGNPRSRDSTTVNFCRGVKFKQQATVTKYLPAAAALASKTAKARKIAAAAGVRSPTVPSWFRGVSEPDVNLLANLDGADQDELSYALAGITPVDIGGVPTKEDVALFGPALVVVGLGLWLVYRR